ncbi:hypothetical protein V3N99_17025 [Dermatophilaceae bacterium Soc4.6]
MIIGLLVAAALLGVLGLVRAVVVRRRATAAGQPTTSGWGAAAGAAGADPAAASDGFPVDDELNATFDAVLAAHAHELGDLLETRLHGLIARQVPVRAIRAAPGTRTARVCFADGTVVLARSGGGRDLAAVVVGMQSGAVVLSGFAREDSLTRLTLRSRSGRPLALLAIGLDQPD